jgi:hypothetical protein
VSDFEEVIVHGAANPCGLVWTPWMGDWFTSFSPRNSNSNAEGTWEHWVTLAQDILNDPLTELVRPEVYKAVPEPPHRYDETERSLTEDELNTRFSVERRARSGGAS